MKYRLVLLFFLLSICKSLWSIVDFPDVRFPGNKVSGISALTIAPITGYVSIDIPVCATVCKSLLLFSYQKFPGNFARYSELCVETFSTVMFEWFFAYKIAMATMQHPLNDLAVGLLVTLTREYLMLEMFDNRNYYIHWLQKKGFAPTACRVIEDVAKIMTRNVISFSLSMLGDFIRNLGASDKSACIPRIFIPVAPAISFVRL